jgi:hypothetical protein
MIYKSKKSTESSVTSETQNTIDNLSDKYINAVSSTDCTGLIPANPESEDALDAYKEIYNYEVPVSKILDKDNSTHYNAK